MYLPHMLLASHSSGGTSALDGRAPLALLTLCHASLEFDREAARSFRGLRRGRDLPQLPALTRDHSGVSRAPFRAGWDEPLANIIARFRCRCGRKLVDVHVGFNKKPRG